MAAPLAAPGDPTATLELTSGNNPTVEGTGGSNTLTYTVKLSAPSTATVRVGYGATPGTAGTSDYTVNGTSPLVFAPGETQKMFTVSITTDSMDELDEEFEVFLTADENVNVVTGSGSEVPNPDNGHFYQSIVQPITWADARDAATALTYLGCQGHLATITSQQESDFIVNNNVATYSWLGGFQDPGTLEPFGGWQWVTGEPWIYTNWAGGEPNNSGNEDYLMLWDQPGQWNDYGTGTHNGYLVEFSCDGLISSLTQTITDDDPAPSLSLSLTGGTNPVTEGTGGTNTLTFTATLSAVSSRIVTVNYGATAGTATGSDYTVNGSGTLTFAPGETQRTFTVNIVTDALDENLEQFTVALSNFGNAVAGATTSIVQTIDDDDRVITIGGPLSVLEGTGAGTTTVDVLISLSSPAGPLGVTVDVAATGTAIDPDDYVLSAASPISFTPGQDTYLLTATIVRDNVQEDDAVSPDQTIVLTLSNPVGGVLGTPSAHTLTITDDDAPTVSINDVTVIEGASTTGADQLVATLSNPSIFDIQVDYVTVDGTASAPDDYAPVASSVIIPNGTLTADIPAIATVADTDEELTEAFIVDLTGADHDAVVAGGTLGEAEVTIVDNDGAPKIFIDPLPVDEGAGVLTFTAGITAPFDSDVTFLVTTSNGTAIAGQDYTGLSAELQTIIAGNTSTTFDVVIVDDGVDEDDEFFFITAHDQSAGDIVDDEGVGTILDNDAAPSVSTADVSVDEGAGTAVVTFTLSAASERDVTITYATANGTALAGSDYSATGGIAAFSPGETTAQIIVPVADDMLDENSEAFTLGVTAGTNVTGTPSATVTVLDNDTAVFNVGTASYVESAGLVNIPITLSNPFPVDTTVDWQPVAGTASVPDGDYLNAGIQTLTFLAGNTTPSTTPQVAIVSDDMYEPWEYFRIELSSPTGGPAIGSNYGVIGITGDDPVPTVSFTVTDVQEGTTGTLPMTFTVELSNPSYQEFAADYAVVPALGTAASEVDYNAASGTVVIPSGARIAQFSVSIIADEIDELAETIVARLSNFTPAYSLADIDATGSIIDDDGAPTISIDDASVFENNGPAVVTVSLSNPSDTLIEVDYGTAVGSAQPADFTATSGTIAFNPGETSAQISIAITNDTADEPIETLFVNLTNVTGGATLFDAQGVVSIVDDDGMPILTVDNAPNANEGDIQAITVRLSNPSSQDVQFTYTANTGTALWSVDFTPTTGNRIIPAGSLTTVINVPTIQDSIDEPNEFYYLNVTNVSNAIVGRGSGMAFIVDDDAPPALSINDVSVSEGDSGTTPLTFTVTLSRVSTEPVSFDYEAVLSGLASADDIVATSGTTSIAPGDLTAVVTVPVVGDTLDEGIETFTLEITNPTNGTGTPIGTGTITDDDDLPVVSIDDVTVLESMGPAVLNITLSNPSSVAITLDYWTLNNTAVAGSDYTAVSVAGFTFNPGETSTQVTVDIANDSVDEPVETFFVSVVDISAGAVAGDVQGTVSIVDDDGQAEFYIGSAFTAEGDAGATVLNVPVFLSQPVDGPSSIHLVTVDGAATVADGDYVPTDLVVNFPANTTGPVNFPITINGDTKFEADETLVIAMDTPTGGPVPASPGFSGIVIYNDDARPSISIADAAVAEGDAGQTSLVFEVSLSAAAFEDISVEYDVTAGTASAGADFSPVTGTVVVAAGDTTASFSVPVMGDLVDETDETVTVALTAQSPAAYAILDGAATGTIIDDDLLPTLAAPANFSVSEDGVTAELTITLSGPSANPVSFTYATSPVGPNPATSGVDYGAGTPASPITIPAGQTSAVVTFPIVSDTIEENNESFLVTIALALGEADAVLGDPTTVVTIVDDDGQPQVFISDAQASEGGNITFTVRLSHALASASSVTFGVVSGTADAGTDFNNVTPTVNFPAGDVSETFIVPTIEDDIDEPTETFFVRITGTTGAIVVADDEAIGVIMDDDPDPELDLVCPDTVTEGDNGTIAIVCQVEIDGGAGDSDFASYPISVDWTVTTLLGSAIPNVDFVDAEGTAVIVPGATSADFTVEVIGDLLLENDEGFVVTITNNQPDNPGAFPDTDLGDFIQAVVIEDDDDITVSIADVTVHEQAGVATLTVVASNPSEIAYNFDVATSDGTAAAGEDYTATSVNNLVMPAGQTSVTVTVPILNDTIDESLETFNVTLSGLFDGSLLHATPTFSDAAAVVSIIDDDGVPFLTVSDVTAVEGTDLAFTVSLSHEPSGPWSFEYYTQDGTAFAPDDYTAAGTPVALVASGPIPANQLSFAINVPALNDTLDEPAEIMQLIVANLSANIEVGDNDALGTIVDDDVNDPTPSITLASAADPVVEGSTGSTTPVVYTATLSGPSASTVTVEYALTSGSALADVDFVAASGVLTFAPGDTSVQFTVDVIADLADESDEEFTVALANPVNALLGVPSSVVQTITDDDDLPTLSIAVFDANAGGLGNGHMDEGNVTFATVTLSPASDLIVTVGYFTVPTTATAGSDFVTAAGLLSFSPGETTKTIDLAALQDLIDEPLEIFAVQLTNATNAAIAGAGTALVGISDDDPVPSVSFSYVPGTTVTEGDVLEFTATLSNPASGPIVINVGTADVTTEGAADFTLNTPVLTFAPGATSATGSVTIADDTIDETLDGGSEVFNLTFAAVGPTPVVPPASPQAIAILDNDATPSLSLLDAQPVTEGSASEFFAALSHPSDQPVSFSWRTFNVTASCDGAPPTIPADFVCQPLTGPVVIPAGATVSAALSVTTINDTMYEDDEIFFGVISAPVNAVLNDTTASAIILDNDGLPTLTISNAIVTEGNVGTVSAVQAILLSHPSAYPVTVLYQTADASATVADGDYTPKSDAAVIPAGGIGISLTTSIVGDTKFEGDDVYLVQMLGAINATVVPASSVGTVTIVNDDGAPTLTFAVAPNPVIESQGQVSVTISLSHPSASPVTGSVVTTDGPAGPNGAIAGQDYNNIAGGFSIPAGQTSVVELITIVNDTADELAQTFTLDLDTVSGATYSPAPAIVTIVDDDAAPRLVVEDITQIEGTVFSFTVTLRDAQGSLQTSDNVVSFDWAVDDVTAVAPGDYTDAGATVLIPAGSHTMVGFIDVQSIDDGLYEPVETFNVSVTNLVNADVADSDLLWVGTILDNDAAPTVSFEAGSVSVSVAEPDSGATSIVLTVEQSAVSDYDTTVLVSLGDGTATVADDDYQDQNNVALLIPAGATTATLTVDVNGDLKFENDETFTATIVAATNAALAAPSVSTVTITNNDAAPTVNVNDISIPEGNAGTANGYFTVSLSAISGLDTTVTWELDDVTASSSVAPLDFADASGSATVPAGQTMVQIPVVVNGDTVFEGNETFELDLLAVTSLTTLPAGQPTAVIGASDPGVATIVDDETVPTIFVSDVSWTEDDAGCVADNIDVMVSLSNATTTDVTFTYTTSDGSAHATHDYATETDTATILANTTSVVIELDGCGDLLVDAAAETFFVTLSGLSLNVASVGSDLVGEITIVDDAEVAPTLAVSDETGVEGSTLTFDFTLSGPLGTDSEIVFETNNVTATAGDDYVGTDSTVIAISELTTLVSANVETIDDVVYEPVPETFNVVVTDPGLAVAGDLTGVGTITDTPDPAPTISIVDTNVVEETATVFVTVVLSGPSGVATTVDYATANASAFQPFDYLPAAGTLNIPAGAISAVIPVSIVEDTLYEFDETFVVTLTNPSVVGTIADSSALVTIYDDDPLPVLSITDTTLTEGNSGSLDITIPTAAGVDISFRIASADGSAIAGSDYTAQNAMYVMSAGITSISIPVGSIEDALFELTEFYTISLTDSVNATTVGGKPVGVVTIEDDDTAGTTVTIDSVAAAEGETALFTVTLGQAAGFDITLDYVTSNGTADSGDYTPETGTVTIPAGLLTAPIDIVTTEDTLYEAAETFNVTISNAPAPYVISTGVGVGTISDDESLPALSVTDVTAAENASTTAFTFVVTQSTISGSPTSFTYTLNHTDTDAADFGAPATTPASPVTIPAGATEAVITVNVLNDNVYELNEDFFLQIADPVNATIADAFGLGTILNDDATPTITVNNVTLMEGSQTPEMTVTRTGATALDVVVMFHSVDGTAVSPLDYNAIDGTVTIPAGGATQSVVIDVNTVGDTIDEPAETYTVFLDSATNAVITDQTGVVTITDNDLAPAIQWASGPAIGVCASEVEGTASNLFRTCTVTLTRQSAFTVTVDYTTNDLTAELADDDYLDNDGTLVFAPGETSKTITIESVADNKFELDEGVTVTLSNPVNASIGLLQGSRIVRIENDDQAPTVSIMADVTVTEDVGTVTITGTLSNPSQYQIATPLLAYLLANSANGINPPFDAIAPGDFAPLVNQVMVFAPESVVSTTNPVVTINDDLLDEYDESFTVTLTILDPLGVGGISGFDDDTAVITILDNDVRPVLTVGDVTVTEGDGGATNLVFEVMLNTPSGRPYSFGYRFVDGTATGGPALGAGVDYVNTGGIITVPKDDVGYPKQIVVPVNPDTVLEGDETFTLELFDVLPEFAIDPINSDFAAVGTIVDDDTATLTLSIADNSVEEGSPLVYTVTIDADDTTAGDQPAEIPVSFRYTVNDGVSPVDLVAPNAANAADYVDENGVQLVIPAGATTVDIAVQTVEDVLFELTEDLSLVIASPLPSPDVTVAVGGPLDGFIENDDAAPTIRINDAQLVEGDTGDTYNMVFSVEMSQPAGTLIWVDYATAAGSATAGADYTSTSGVAAFQPGDTETFIVIPVLGDLLTEGNETFTVTLSNAQPTDAVTTNVPTFSDATATGVIVDDEVAPLVTIDDVTVLEGSADGLTAGNTAACTGVVTFTVTLGNPSANPISFTYATSDGTAQSTHDYPAVAGAAALTIPAGSTVGTFDVAFCQDTYDDLDTEAFNVTIAPTVAGIIAPAGHDLTGTATITDDDAAPTITIADDSKLENFGPLGNQLLLRVTLSTPSGRPTSFNRFSFDGNPAVSPAATVADSDYQQVVLGTVELPPLTAFYDVLVVIVPDTKYEENEHMYVAIMAGSGLANGADTIGMGTILNDDPMPTLSISDAEVVEGTGAGTTVMAFTVTQSAITGAVTNFTINTTDGTALAATDYTAIVDAAGTIPAGETHTTVLVTVNRDALYEYNETFDVVITPTLLAAPVQTNATIADGTGVGTIIDDDVAPTLSITDATVAEGDLATPITVSLSALSGRDVVFDYTTTPGTATAADYVPESGTVTIPAGTLSVVLDVQTTEDVLHENAETFTVDILSATNVAINGNDFESLVTITDDDAAPVISIADAAATEGSNLVFAVTLDAVSGKDTVFTYSTANSASVFDLVAPNPAAADIDYEADENIEVVIPAGALGVDVTVATSDDVLYEVQEDLLVNVTPVDGATAGDVQATGLINDNDPLPVVSVTDNFVEEGSGLSFQITLDAVAGVPVTVNYATATGLSVQPAVDGVDYTTTAGTATIPAGDVSVEVVVPTTEDTLHEVDEDFQFNLAAPVNAVLGNAAGTGDILDDDAQPTLSVIDTSVAEGNAGLTAVNVTVELSTAAGVPVTVEYSTLDGTATLDDDDYLTAAGTITFAPGIVSQTVALSVVGDTKFELDETFQLVLGTPVNAAIFDGTGIVTITNDDTAPQISIADAPNAAEGTIDNTTRTFVVTLSNASYLPVSVNYTTTDGTSPAPALVADSDYVLASGTLTFAPDDLSETVTVTVLADNKFELDEDFTVDLSGEVNATILDGQATTLILNDDAQPVVTIMADTSVDEGVGSVNVTASLSNPTYQTIVLDVATLDGTAVAPGDYTAAVAATLTFASGSVTPTAPVSIPVIDDAIDEYDETFTATVAFNGGPYSASIADDTAVVTIVDNDDAPRVIVVDNQLADPEADEAVAEGASASTTPIVFAVQLVDPVTGLPTYSGKPVTFTWQTQDGTASAADTPVGDYVAVVPTVVTIPADTLSGSATLPVTVNGDDQYEMDELFSVVLSDLTNVDPIDANNDLVGDGKIVNDDALPTVSIDDVALAEGNAGETNFVFTISLSAESGTDTAVFVSTADGAAPAATVLDGDYVPQTNTMILIPEGTLTAAVTVKVIGDAKYEYDELFNASIVSAINATVADGVGLGTIVNDDAAPTLTIADTEVFEGDAGTTQMVFTVTSSALSGVPAGFSWSTADGVGPAGATVADSDYVAVVGASGVVQPGFLSTTVSVTVNGDLQDELNEAFTVTIAATAPDAANGADVVATGTILNDDFEPVLSIGDETVVETHAGIVDVTFDLTLTEPTSDDVEVFYRAIDGTTPPAGTLADNDFQPLIGKWVIPADTTAISFTLSLVNGDTKFEQDDVFHLELYDAYNATLGDHLSNITIVNDDTQPVVTVLTPVVSVDEPDSGQAPMTFTAVMSNASYQTVTVVFNTTDGTASFIDTPTGDYDQVVNQLVTFVEDDLSEDFVVLINGDNKYELDETLNVTISGAVNGSIGAPDTHVGTIVNDDPIPTVHLPDASVMENAGPLAITATLSNPSYETITIDLVTTQGTAQDPADYTGTAGTSLSFAQGTLVSSAFDAAIVNDAFYEPDETFTGSIAVTTGTVQGAGNDLNATYTIVNDDVMPGLSISDVTLIEGNSPGNTTAFVFDVTLTSVTGVDVGFTINTIDDTATALAGDYAAIAGASGLITAGTDATTVTVLVDHDLKVETNETFFVVLSNLVNAAPDDTTGLGTILNDDNAIVVVDPGTLNGGFESGLNPWLKKGVANTHTADKIKCDKPNKPAHQGSCYFSFKGSPNEDAKLVHKVPSSAFPALALNDGVRASLFYRTNAAIPTFGLKVRVEFTDGTTALVFGQSMPVAPTNSEWRYMQVEMPLTQSIAIKRVKIILRNATESGPIDIDSVRLEVVPGLGNARGASGELLPTAPGTRGTAAPDVIPAPLAPADFRGGN